MKKIISFIIRFLSNILFRIYRNKISVTSNVSLSSKVYDTIIGKWSYVAPYSVINMCKIGNYTSIGPGCNIGGMEHSYWYLSTSTFLSDQCVSNQLTVIGNDVWIAAGVTIKQGIKIGDGAIVGANSFVTKDVPPYSITFGIPAKHHKYRFDESTIKNIISSQFWFFSPLKAKSILKNLSSSLKL